MAGTNVGAVYIDLKLNVKDLQRGFSDIGRHVGGLEGMFGRLQDGLARVFAPDSFAPAKQAFEGLTEGMNPVKGGLGLVKAAFEELTEGMNPVQGGLEGLQKGLTGLIERVPVLTQDFFDNIDAQDLTLEALERLTEGGSEFDYTVKALTKSLEEMPFTYLEESVYDLGYAIEGLDEKSQMFGKNWREMLGEAKKDAEDVNTGFNEIFGMEIPATWRDMVGGLREGWSTAWTGMKQAFHGIINRIIGGINNMIGGLNNFNIDLPGWLGGGSFGFSIPKIPKVPALAKGGIVAAPTLALVGERGREAVLPLENNTGWMADLANVLAEALVANQAYSRGQGDAKVNLYMDGRKVAEGIIDDLYEEAGRRDLNPVWA